MASVVRDALLCPEFLDDLQDLEKARQAVVRRHLEGPELKISPTQSRRQNETAAADDVERGQLLGELDRMGEGQEPHDAQLEAGRFRGDTGQQDRGMPAIVQIARPNPQRVKTALLRRSCFGEQRRERLLPGLPGALTTIENHTKPHRRGLLRGPCPVVQSPGSAAQE